MRQDLIRVLITDEPDELIAHVRICGGGGPVTAASTRNLTLAALAQVTRQPFDNK